MKIIILAGGGGTRLFPLSRTSFPKQFLKLNTDTSLLGATIKRFENLVSPEDIIIVTNSEHLFYVKGDLKEINAQKAHVLLEPTGRNTAPAIALALSYCKDNLNCSDDEIMFVSPADHIIKNTENFEKSFIEAEKLAHQSFIATFGVIPCKPETGFGYIKAGDKIGTGFLAEEFREKPDLKTAQEYLASGNYYWNSGMFCFSAGTMKAELAKHAPQIAELLDNTYCDTLKNFEKMPSISIDYAVAEKSDKMALIPLASDWNDVGSWDAIYNLAEKDENGNAVIGDCVTEGCKNSLFLGRERMITGIDLEDLLVIETDDVIMVAKRGHSQKVKEIVEKLKKEGRKEAKEHLTVHRPWGSYSILGEGPDYKIKRIIVTPEAALSLQMHYHRSEHWVVIEGTAKPTVNDEIKMVHTGESLFIPMSVKHRLENPGKIPLKIIEVQNGSYLEEDDIVRFDDIYSRCSDEERSK